MSAGSCWPLTENGGLSRPTELRSDLPKQTNECRQKLRLAPFADLADGVPRLFKQTIGNVETRCTPVVEMARSCNVGLS